MSTSLPKENCEWPRINAKWKRENGIDAAPQARGNVPGPSRICNECKHWVTETVDLMGKYTCFPCLRGEN
jgi:hypothetical protein